MIQLLYPLEPAPVVGVRNENSEMLPVVDSIGRVYAQSSRENCHNASEALMHPVVHLEIVDRYSRIYLQRRSPRKKKYALRWDIAVGGHVSYAESFSQALRREAREEIGLEEFNPQFLANYITEEEGDVELVGLYVAVGTFSLSPDGDEVCDGRYWTQEEISKNIGAGIFTPDFEEEYLNYNEKILALL